MAQVGVAFTLHACSARVLGGSGGHAPPGKFWIFKQSESVSGAF